MKTAVPASISGHGRTLVYYRDLILVLLAKEFKVRYKSTFVGYAWSVMHPLVLAIIFFSLFGVILRVPGQGLRAVPDCRAVPLAMDRQHGSTANFYFLGNGSLIKKVRFHRATLVLAGVLNESVHFLVSIPVIVGFMLYYGRGPSVDWLWMLPALVLLQVAMTFGLGLLVATSNLFFRDLERLVALAMHLLFYATPIVYPAENGCRWNITGFSSPIRLPAIVICWQGLFYQGPVSLGYLGIAAGLVVRVGSAGLAGYTQARVEIRRNCLATRPFASAT